MRLPILSYSVVLPIFSKKYRYANRFIDKIEFITNNKKFKDIK
jgi:hypothetical protein